MPIRETQVAHFNRYHYLSAIVISLLGLISYYVCSFGDPVAVIAGALFSLVNGWLYVKLVQGVVELKSTASATIIILLKFPILLLIVYLVSKQSNEFIYSALTGALSFVPAAIYAGLRGYVE